MRVTWVDNAKALGIIAIVAGHAPGLNELLRNFLYSFHVPLFFFLSGYLLKPKHLDVSFPGYVKRNVERLVVPYVFFWGLSFLLWLGFQLVGGKRFWEEPGMILEALQGLLVGTSESLLDVNGVLWFYTSLFTAVLVFYGVARHRSSAWVFAVLLLSTVLAGIAASSGQRLPWNLDLVFLAMVFYGAGYLTREWRGLERVGSEKGVALLAILGAGMTLVVSLINGKVDMSWQFYGDSFYLYLLGAFAGILFSVALGRFIPASRLGRYLSDNAIVIYSIHFPMFFAFWGVGVYLLKLPRDFDQSSMLIALLYTVGAFLLCVPAIRLIRRFMPWGLGARTASVQPSTH
ncbi:MAG: acyltransferase family protein [bacterium]